MNRHLVKVTGLKEQRRELNLDDVRDISRQADEYGIYRFVLTGGEPTTWKDLFSVIEAVDPSKHLVILDSNAWLLDEMLAKRLADAGVYKTQISLDSFIEAEHDLDGALDDLLAALRKLQDPGQSVERIFLVADIHGADPLSQTAQIITYNL